MAGRKLACFAAAFSFILLLLCLTLRRPTLGLWLAGAAAAALFVLMAVFAGVVRAFVTVGLAAACAVFLFQFDVETYYQQAQSLVETEDVFTIEVTDFPTHGSYYTVIDGFLQGRYRGARVSAVIYEAAFDAAPGDHVVCTGAASIQSGEYFVSSAAERRFVTIRVQDGDAELEKAERIALRYVPLHVSQKLRDTLRQYFSCDSLGLLSALLTGSKAELSKPFKNALALSGTSHITAVSGMHVGLIAALMLYLLGRRRGMAAALPIMLFFGLATGMNPPVMRALLMTTVAVGAYSFEREGDNLTTVMFALLVILLFDPCAVLSLSLQLSFASVLGIMTLNAPIRRTMEAYLSVSLSERPWVRRAILAVSVSIPATVGALPVSAFYFPRMSVISPLTNLAVLWLVPLLMGGGVLFAAFAPLWPVGAKMMAGALELMLRLFAAIVQFFARLPFSSISTRDALLLPAFALSAVFLILGYRIRPKHRKAAVAVLALILAALVSLRVVQRFQTLDVAVCESGLTLVRCGFRTVAMADGAELDQYALDDYLETLFEWGRLEADCLLAPDDMPGAGELASEIRTDQSFDVGAISLEAHDGCCLILADKKAVVRLIGLERGSALADFGLPQEVDLLILDDALAGDYYQMRRVREILTPAHASICGSTRRLKENDRRALLELLGCPVDETGRGSTVLHYSLR